jgi:hypothetical protein
MGIDMPDIAADILQQHTLNQGSIDRVKEARPPAAEYNEVVAPPAPLTPPGPAFLEPEEHAAAPANEAQDANPIQGPDMLQESPPPQLAAQVGCDVFTYLVHLSGILVGAHCTKACVDLESQARRRPGQKRPAPVSTDPPYSLLIDRQVPFSPLAFSTAVGVLHVMQSADIFKVAISKQVHHCSRAQTSVNGDIVPGFPYCDWIYAVKMLSFACVGVSQLDG